MTPWTSKEHAPASHEQDLSTLLSPDQRAELPLLIAKISEVMRKHITDIYDISESASKSSSQGLHSNMKNLKLEDNTPPHKETDEEQKSRKFWESRENELSKPKQQELKKVALDYLQKWQENVIKRVEEALKEKDVVQKHGEEVKAEAAQTPDTAPPPDTKVITENTNVEDSDAALIQLYPPTSTSLLALPKERRVLVLHAMLLLLLSLEHYVGYSRVLLLNMSSSLHLPLHILAENEVALAQGLVEGVGHTHMSGDAETKHRSDVNKNARRWKIGLAGVAGAAIIGVTGGLAAPLVAAGVATVVGGLGLEATAAAALLGTLAESSVVVGALFGAYGGSMTGKMMDEYAKEVQDFAFLPLRVTKKGWHSAKEIPVEDRRLRVTIGISGWLKQKEDVVAPWRILGHQTEVYALRWELEALIKLGTTLESLVKSYAWSVAKKEIIERTIIAGLMDAMWPLAVLKVGEVVDNPFNLAKNLADKAGRILADALINKAQGERPVTLIGYSLGARLIYSCLRSLAERHAFGLVESVVMMGTPATSDPKVWRALRSVVCGRLVNVYSENDLILAFLYRASAIQFGIAGIHQVEDVKGIENVNVSKVVSGHLRYQYLVGTILEKIGWEDIDLGEVAQEEETLALMEEDEKKEQARKVKDHPLSAEDEAARMEKEANEKTDQRMKQNVA